MYALNLAADGRILLATFEEFSSGNEYYVDILPEGNLYDYRVDPNTGEYIYDPVVRPAAPVVPTQMDRIEAQVTYTAMMTDTLLEG